MTAHGTAPLPPGLRDRIVTASLSRREPGRSSIAVAEISPVEALRRAAREFDELLASLTADEWHRRALRGHDVQGLVGHLIGVEEDVQRALVAPRPDADAADHVESTEPSALAQAGRTQAQTRAAWAAAVAETIALVEDLPAGALDREVSVPSLRMPLSALLVVRVFELWTHENDIRRAVGRSRSAPDAACLQLMTALVMRLLPAGLARAGRAPFDGVVRLVLTGPGGGAWDVPLTGDAAGAARTRIVADATEFCRLVASRLTPDELGADVTGDRGLADDVLAGAAALALD